MNDFTILHLSDLHINGTGKGLTPLLKNLLSDIKEELKPVDNVILVITGDIIDKANYEKCKENVLAFFEQLKDVLAEKLKDVYIVPGNHDRVHKPFDECTIEYYDEARSEEFKKSYWQYIMVGYGEYISLINNIYGILGVSHRADNTYGVRCTEINGKKICFLSLDTSWSSNGGEQDIRALKFGRFQAEDIYQQYNKAVEDKNADLVIALAHHPLDWLTGKEPKYCTGGIAVSKSS